MAYSDEQLRELRSLLGDASDAERRQAAIGVAVGRLLGWAGKQSPIAADKGGNYADLGVWQDGLHRSLDDDDAFAQDGERRECCTIYRVLERVLRRPFDLDHYSAQIESLGWRG